MPRKDNYQPWSSKNCKLLRGFPTYDEHAEVHWRDAGKKVPAKGDKPEHVLHSVEGAQGRPHREEAVLIQIVGNENESPCSKCAKSMGAFETCVSAGNIHRGACGCCVWDSKPIDCTLQAVLDTLEAENAIKQRQDDLKRHKTALRGKVSSKAPRKRKATDNLENGDEAAEAANNNEAGRVTTRSAFGSHGIHQE